MRSSFLNRFSKTIPAGSQIRLPAHGSLFVCKEAGAPFQVQFDDGEINTVDAGFSIDLAPDGFRRTTLINPQSDLDIEVEIFIGRAGVRYDYLRERPTSTVATRQTVAVGNTLTLPGTNKGRKRRSAIITNWGPEPANPVLETVSISLDGVNRHLFLPYRIPIQIDTTSELIIYNGTLADVEITAVEMFYSV